MKKKGNKGKINETKVYVAVLVLIFLAAIIISVVRMGDGGKEPADPTPTAPAETVPGTTTTDDPNSPDEPEDTPEPTPSAAPQTTPRPTATPSPTPTPTPTPTPAPASDLGSGSFASDTKVGLDLVVDWSAGAAGEGTSSVTFSVSLKSYSLYTSALPGALTLTVGSETYSFDTPAVSYDGHTQITTPFATKTVTVPAGTVSVSAQWYYRGTYSGKYLESITASGVIDAG